MNFKEKYLENGKSIIIYGAEIWGKLALNALLQLGVTPIYFCDRIKKGTNILEIPVIGPEEISDFTKYNFLICATRGFKSIYKFLKDSGATNIYDMCNLLDVVDYSKVDKTWDLLTPNQMKRKYLFYAKDENINLQQYIELPEVSICITQKCTMKCKNCVSLIPYNTSPQNYDINMIINTLDNFFKCIDKVIKITIIGGEVFLHPELYKIVNWCCKNKKIDLVVVLTNSTIIPRNDNLSCLINNNVQLCLDDYGKLSTKFNELISFAEKNKINYTIMKNEYWYDISSTDFRNYSDIELRNLFINCTFANCFGIEDGKFYRCPREYRNMVLKNIPYKCNSIVNLNEHLLDSQKFNVNECRKQILDLIYNKNFLEGCKYCLGSGVHDNKIPVAIQMD